MKAEDTVLNREHREELLTRLDNCESLCLAQAEISFKAGMQEVVEWIYVRIPNPFPYVELEWQAKLKEWGLK